MLFSRFLLLLLFFTGSINAQAALSCNNLFERQSLQTLEQDYLSSKDYYHRLNGPKDADKHILKRIQNGYDPALEAIAYLDSASKGNLFQLVQQQNKNAKIHKKIWSIWLSIEGNQIRLKSIKAEEIKHVQDFIANLLTNIYQAELLRSKDRLFSVPLSNRLDRINSLDNFFYQNLQILDPYISLKKQDHWSLMNHGITNTFLRFFLFFGDPVLSHRLNQSDLKAFEAGQLTKNLRQRLLRPEITYSLRRKILWSYLGAKIVMAAMAIPDLMFAKDLVDSIANNTKENMPVLVEQIGRSYHDFYTEGIKANVHFYQQKLNEETSKPLAKQNSEAIIKYESLLKKYQEDLDKRLEEISKRSDKSN